jgi:hypothetical protein
MIGREVLNAYGGGVGKEPGIKPSAENIALFVVSYPVPILDSGSPDPSESIPIACGALRKLDQDYMEVRPLWLSHHSIYILTLFIVKTHVRDSVCPRLRSSSIGPNSPRTPRTEYKRDKRDKTRGRKFTR